MKKDRYRRVRGGSSQMLAILCSNCGTELFHYQKDGPGQLLRCYLDRISASEPIEEKKALVCPACTQLIGVPMLYAPEKRPAFRLVPGTFRKVKIS